MSVKHLRGSQRITAYTVIFVVEQAIMSLTATRKRPPVSKIIRMRSYNNGASGVLTDCCSPSTRIPPPLDTAGSHAREVQDPGHGGGREARLRSQSLKSSSLIYLDCLTCNDAIQLVERH